MIETWLASLDAHWRALADSLVGLFVLLATWAAYRAKNALVSHWADDARERTLETERRLELMRQQEIARCNETLRKLIEASVHAELPSLESLLANAERDWSLKPAADSRPNAEPARNSTRRSDDSGLRLRPDDWSDDTERTEVMRDDTRPGGGGARRKQDSWPPRE